MGRRGPGARALLDAGRRGGVVAAGSHPWEAEGLTRAERVIAFLQDLPVTKGFGVGEKIELLPFQLEWLRAVYAEDQDSRRPVRTALMSVARGNGKTVLVAGLCLAHLVGPEAESRGECYSAAATKEQASLLFAEIEAWVYAVPWLAARLNVETFHKRIRDRITGSVYRALASDGPAAHGLAASFICCDELAQWKRRELFDVLRTSMGKRQEPLLVAIGTQSPDADNIMSELVDYAGRLKAGEVEDRTFHGVCHEIPKDLDVFDPANWHLANPALGLFRSHEELAAEAARAVRIPTFENAFRNLYCNQRVAAEARAIDPGEWDACGQDAVPLLALAGAKCWAGLDLSNVRDLTALVLYFPELGGAVLAHFWCPQEAIAEKEEIDRVPYRTWAKQGLITPTPGKAIDKEFVAAKLAEVAAMYDLQGVAFDRWGMAALQVILDRQGVNLPLVPFGQGWRDMGPAVDAFETAMLTRKLNHGGNPVLRWMAGNAVFSTDPTGARKFSKDRSRDKIDGLVALTMAMGLAARTEAPKEFAGSVAWL